MDLQSIAQQLQKELLQNKSIEIKKQMQYSIPIHTLEVKYHPVIRNSMDILMKMMLISFEKAKLKNVELLAEILLVEPLFIHDLTNKMIRLGMIVKDDVYTLTSKGKAQLQSGVFEEELEETSYFIQYSPIHEQPLEGDLEEFVDLEEFPEPFPTIESDEIDTVEETKLIEFIQQQLNEQPLAEEEVPQLITSIASTESIQINDIPVLAFLLYDQQEKHHFSRVFNTLTGAWDDQLETKLFHLEKEQFHGE